ncbi:MAG TPA: thioredoxin family protein [Gemmatimonadales bacterium]|nr:thioredoxin family protein [Gemmatimonadales bacterium]
MTTFDFRALWDQALPFEAYVAASSQHRGLWEGLYRLARIPQWALDAVPAGTRRRLLVLAEDWCGDASNTVPVVARLADAVPELELRVLRRDEHPEVMDRYLTNGSRSIPVVIALTEDFAELGHWGPRPSELQSWVLANRQTIPKSELYPQVRRWYARDRGESTLREVLTAAGFSVARVA